MLKTYRKTFKMSDETEKEVEFRHLTARDILKILDNPALLASENLIDLVAPKLLDELSLDSVFEVVDYIQESDKDFFTLVSKEVAKLVAKAIKKQKQQMRESEGKEAE